MEFVRLPPTLVVPISNSGDARGDLTIGPPTLPCVQGVLGTSRE